MRLDIGRVKTDDVQAGSGRRPPMTSGQSVRRRRWHSQAAHSGIDTATNAELRTLKDGAEGLIAARRAPGQAPSSCDDQSTSASQAVWTMAVSFGN